MVPALKKRPGSIRTPAQGRGEPAPQSAARRACGPAGQPINDRKAWSLMEEKKENFEYTYSAKEQAEIRAIRQKYLPPEESKLDQLRKLDKSAAKKGTVVSVTVGVLGTLVLGLGMCCTMVWVELFAPGIVIGLAGIALVAAAYPIYRRVTRREREKLAPQILKLTEELQKP